MNTTTTNAPTETHDPTKTPPTAAESAEVLATRARDRAVALYKDFRAGISALGLAEETEAALVSDLAALMGAVADQENAACVLEAARMETSVTQIATGAWDVIEAMRSSAEAMRERAVTRAQKAATARARARVIADVDAALRKA